MKLFESLENNQEELLFTKAAILAMDMLSYILNSVIKRN